MLQYVYFADNCCIFLHNFWSRLSWFYFQYWTNNISVYFFSIKQAKTLSRLLEKFYAYFHQKSGVRNLFFAPNYGWKIQQETFSVKLISLIQNMSQAVDQ